MPTIEERVAYIEGQMSEQSHALVEVREAVRSLEHRTDSRFEAMERRFDALDQKVSNHFVWLVGLHVTTLVAIVGALLARS